VPDNGAAVDSSDELRQLVKAIDGPQVIDVCAPGTHGHRAQQAGIRGSPNVAI
jgi:hypothetical protein